MKNFSIPIMLSVGGLIGSALANDGHPSETGIACAIGMLFGGILTLILPIILQKP
jgi:peptidoglycan biosynthesis protein MviN/MurJ (putative lipid II flippase)